MHDRYDSDTWRTISKGTEFKNLVNDLGRAMQLSYVGTPFDIDIGFTIDRNLGDLNG